MLADKLQICIRIQWILSLNLKSVSNKSAF